MENSKKIGYTLFNLENFIDNLYKQRNTTDKEKQAVKTIRKNRFERLKNESENLLYHSVTPINETIKELSNSYTMVLDTVYKDVNIDAESGVISAKNEYYYYYQFAKYCGTIDFLKHIETLKESKQTKGIRKTYNVKWNIEPLELVELVTSLIESNKAVGTQTDIFNAFVEFFNIELSHDFNFSKKFNNIEARKTERAVFLSLLKKQLILKIETKFEKKEKIEKIIKNLKQ